MKKILIIHGHPSKESFNAVLIDAFKKGLNEQETPPEIREIILADLALEPYLKSNGKMPAGKEIQDAQALISWADHLVFFHPVWWGGTPAILKLFIDIVFSSGFAFTFKKGSMRQEKLLKGKSATIISTADTPPFIYTYLFGAPSINQLKSRTLAFCGIAPVSTHLFGPISIVTNEKRQTYIDSVFRLGKKLKIK
jgi:putative NADPH-quinone reductase